MEGGDAETGSNSVLSLMRAVDEYIPTPERAVDRPFLMPIEDVFRSRAADGGDGACGAWRCEGGRRD